MNHYNSAEFPGLSPEIAKTIPENMARAMRESGISDWSEDIFTDFCRRHNQEVKAILTEIEPAVHALAMDEGDGED